MEKPDRDFLISLLPTNHELRKLYDEHCKLEAEIERLERSPAKLSSQILDVQRLKKRKLRGMDRIMSLLQGARGDNELQVAAL